MSSTFWVITLLITEFILFGFVFLRLKGDFISPSVVTLAFFILSTACCLYGLSDWTRVVFTGKAYALFSLSFLLMVITELTVKKYSFGTQKKINEVSRVITPKRIYIKEPLNTLLFAVFIFAAFYYVYRVYRSGMRLGASSLLTAIGYSKEEGDFDGLSRLLYNLTRLASYVYAVMACNNIFCCKESVRKNWKALAIIAASVIITFFSGQRSSSMTYIISIVVAATISMQDSRNTTRKIDTKKFVRRLAIVAVAVIAVFYLSANIVKGVSIERRFVDYITYYFGSTTGLMGTIVEDPSICHTPFVGYFGEKTFMGFWNTMYSWGIVNAAPADRRWINMGSHIANRAGNEYTFLCGPYIDFGFVGALIFVVLFFWVICYIYYKKIKSRPMTRRRVSTIAIYIFLYVMVSMDFYQDTIRTYSRPMNILYIIYIVVFCRLLIRFKEKSIKNT